MQALLFPYINVTFHLFYKCNHINKSPLNLELNQNLSMSNTGRS